MTAPVLPADVPVLIVGGGGCGLSASVMLADLGVESLLVERHPGTALMPKAHIINPRTMEIFEQAGVVEDVCRAGAPPDSNRVARWYTSFGGDEPWHRQAVHVTDSWSGGALTQHYEKLTAWRHGNLPQRQLEPILRRHAEERNPGGVRFHHELVALEQHDDGVVATILDRDTGTETQTTARYVVAADGGKTVASMLDIELEGPEPFVHTISVYFRADLARYIMDDDTLLRFIVRPTLDGGWMRTGCLTMGPTRWDRHSEEWVVTVTLPPGREHEEYDEERAAAAVRERLCLPDLDIDVIRISRWQVEAVLAKRYGEGRIFLAGDAAHRHSPHGGLGLNTGIQDAHNLCWKLAAVLSGAASEELLASYEAERRPVARRNIDFATFAFFNHLAVGSGFGVMPSAPPEHNRAALEALFSDTPDGETRRLRLREFFGTLRMEFAAADIELGYEYSDSSVVVPDGTLPPARDPAGLLCEATARPGHRLPHAFLDRAGQTVGTHNLLRTGAFLVLAGADGGSWCDAGEAAAKELGIPLEAHRVGSDAELRCIDGRWTALRGHGEAGAILVRPDGHVAFRSFSAPTGNEMSSALQLALGHGGANPVGTHR